MDSEDNKWERRRMWRDHFKHAIAQAYLHTDSISEVCEGIVWACVESHINRATISDAYKTLDF